MDILENKQLQLRPLSRENAIDLRFIAMAMGNKALQDYMTKLIDTNNHIKEEIYGIFYEVKEQVDYSWLH